MSTYNAILSSYNNYFQRLQEKHEAECQATEAPSLPPAQLTTFVQKHERGRAALVNRLLTTRSGFLRD